METIITINDKKVVISPDLPTVLIGERINPTGKKKLAQSLSSGDFSIVKQEAQDQVAAGADILDVNVGVVGHNEPELMVRAIEAIMEEVEVPLCLDSNDPATLEAGLRVYPGRALINSVTAEQRSLAGVLPLVKQYGAAVIALPLDENGIPDVAEKRQELAQRIIEKAVSAGIEADRIIIDSLAMSVGAQAAAGTITLETIRLLKKTIGGNQTLGLSNISFGLPDRQLLNRAFLTMAIAAGVTCPVVDVAQMKHTVSACDLALGHDTYARRYIAGYHERKKKAAAEGA